MEQLKKTIVGINIPAIKETAEGKLRGGFAAFSMMDARNNDDNGVCSNNIECSGNGVCSNNQVCHSNDVCRGNLTTTTTTTTTLPPFMSNPWCTFFN